MTNRLLRFVEQEGWHLSALHEFRNTIFSKSQVDRLFKKDISWPTNSYYDDVYNGAPNLTGLDSMLRADLLALLPGKFLVKMDRMSMGNSLEARSPFLDQNVVEFAARLPVEFNHQKDKRRFSFETWGRDLSHKI